MREKHLRWDGIARLCLLLPTYLLSNTIGIGKTNIFNGLLKCGINYASMILFQRYLEKRADAGVPDTRELLQAGILFLQNHYKQVVTSMRSVQKKSASREKINKLISRFGVNLVYFIDNHPHPRKRVAWLRKRLKSINNSVKSEHATSLHQPYSE